MTEKQMVRALKKYNISLVYDPVGKLWYAGDLEGCSIHAKGHELELVMDIKYRGSQHVAHEPEGAVEDYCNARNLEWDS